MMKLKKIIAAAASVVMACVFATSAFAASNLDLLKARAPEFGFTAEDVQNVVGSEAAATQIVNEREFYKARYNTITTTNDVAAASQAANEVAAKLQEQTGKTVTASVSVSGNKIVVSGTVKDANGNVLVSRKTESVAALSEHPEIGEAIKNGTWGVDEKKATAAATVSAPSGVIKATGDNTAVVLMMGALMIVGVLGLAVRKSDAEA